MFSFVLKRSMTSATSGFSQGTSKFVMFAHERSLKFLSDVDQTLKEIEESNEKCKKLGLNHYFLKLLTSEIDKVLINPNEIDALLSPLIKGNPGCCGISASVPYKLTAESSLSSNLVKNLTRIAVHLRKMTPNDQPLSMNIGLGIGKNELSEVENESADVHFAESIRNTTKICTDLFRDSLEYSVLFGVDKTMGNGEFTRKHFEILHESMPGEAMMAYKYFFTGNFLFIRLSLFAF